MFSATRRWFRRNRTPVAIGVGVVGAGFLATQYVLNKINDARERMSSDRIAKENLRRRFEQNQEDCTFTVLALLPTATANILEAMNTEKITLEIQQMKSAAKSTRSGDSNAAPPSIADTTLTEGEEGKSVASLQSESGSACQPNDASSVVPNGRWGSRRRANPCAEAAEDEATAVGRLNDKLHYPRLHTSIHARPPHDAHQENNDDENDPEHQVYGSDFDINRKYLTFSWWLLNKGWEELGRRVEEAVRDVFGHLSPRDLLSYDTFTQLTFEVRKKIEGTATLKRASRGDPSGCP
ncbi:Peroxisomal biogenesis factor 3 [Apiospora phragmitis]|uniref:Peroxisomal biogenesis factor 3 n=1 Tax=Apiospora phragmitis TaxID=2905665 RepID=A0ABR1TP44_9PEZI